MTMGCELDQRSNIHTASTLQSRYTGVVRNKSNIRKIAKLDHEAAMAAFSSFINEENLNAQQIFFVQQVISHVENNGYMEDPGVLLRAPFDRPVPFFRLFNEGQQQRLVVKIRERRENAVVA